MDYWAATMQDDCYLIAVDGWKAETYRVIEKDKKGKEKDKGWAWDLIPKDLIVAHYYLKEQAVIDELAAKLDRLQLSGRVPTSRGMNQKREPGIIICSLYHLTEVIEQADAVVSVLGKSDKLLFPDVGNRAVLRLALDDTNSSENFIAPSREQIADLIAFARRWNGVGTLLVHCRAGSSRSPAAAMIAAAALGRPDSSELMRRVRTAKAYFRPNETMLKLADDLLGGASGLVDLARFIPAPTQRDPWGPVWIPLTALREP